MKISKKKLKEIILEEIDLALSEKRIGLVKEGSFINKLAVGLVLGSLGISSLAQAHQPQQAHTDSLQQKVSASRKISAEDKKFINDLIQDSIPELTEWYTSDEFLDIVIKSKFFKKTQKQSFWKEMFTSSSSKKEAIRQNYIKWLNSSLPTLSVDFAKTGEKDLEPNTHAFYDIEENSIVINTDMLGDKSSLKEVVPHELGHFFRVFYVNTGKLPGSKDTTKPRDFYTMLPSSYADYVKTPEEAVEFQKTLRRKLNISRSQSQEKMFDAFIKHGIDIEYTDSSNTFVKLKFLSVSDKLTFDSKTNRQLSSSVREELKRAYESISGKKMSATEAVSVYNSFLAFAANNPYVQEGEDVYFIFNFKNLCTDLTTLVKREITQKTSETV